MAGLDPIDAGANGLERLGWWLGAAGFRSVAPHRQSIDLASQMSPIENRSRLAQDRLNPIVLERPHTLGDS